MSIFKRENDKTLRDSPIQAAAKSKVQGSNKPMAKVLDKLRKVGATANKKVMETYVPVSQKELEFWNMHILLNYKNLSVATGDDNIFKAANIPYVAGKRPADKAINTADRPGKAEPINTLQGYISAREETEVEYSDEQLDELMYAVKKGDLETTIGEPDEKKVIQTKGKPPTPANRNSTLKLVKKEDVDLFLDILEDWFVEQSVEEQAEFLDTLEEGSLGWKRLNRVQKSTGKDWNDALDTRKAARHDPSVSDEDFAKTKKTVNDTRDKHLDVSKKSHAIHDAKKARRSVKEAISADRMRLATRTGDSDERQAARDWDSTNPKADKLNKNTPNGSATKASLKREDANLAEDSMSLARLRVQRSKLKKRLKDKPDDVPMNHELVVLDNQIKNINRGEKIKNVWAGAVEKGNK